MREFCGITRGAVTFARLCQATLLNIGRIHRLAVHNFPNLHLLQWGDPVVFTDENDVTALAAIDFSGKAIQVLTDNGLGVLPKARVKFGLHIPEP